MRRALSPRFTLLPFLALVACGGRQVAHHADGSAAPSGEAGLPTSGCASSAECAPADYCHRDAGCPTAAARGTCRPRPTGCARDCPGVCGCDGKTYCNACNAQSDGVNVRSEGACGSCAASCHVRNDCCSCEATTDPGPGPACAMACEVPRCDGVGIGEPVAYCVDEQCLLTSTSHRCKVDGDCVKVDDCCFCLAHPKSAPDPTKTCAADCLVGTCTARGLADATPRCSAGLCKLVR